MGSGQNPICVVPLYWLVFIGSPIMDHDNPHHPATGVLSTTKELSKWPITNTMCIYNI